MRIYVAGRTKNIEEVNLIQEVVMERGHEITHDWTGVEGEIRDSWRDNPERARQIATLDVLGVVKADGLILCGYGCGEGEGGLGCFIEVGLAIATTVPMIILGPARESVFWYSPWTLRVNYKESDQAREDQVEIGRGVTITRTADDIVKLETALAINGLESLHRQKRLALDPTDTSVNL